MKFVVSFTTSPLRVSKMDEMMCSILSQSRAPDLFLLNVPDRFSRTGEQYNIPEDVKSKLTVNNCGRDWGPATKVIPTVTYLKEHGYDPTDTCIIYLDDDIRYPHDMINTLERLMDGSSIWTATGFHFKNFAICGQRVHGQAATIAEGYGAVCVPLTTFKDDFIEYITHYMDDPDTRLSDDMTLSNYYAKHGKPIKICNIRGAYSIFDIWTSGGVLEYGNESDALHNGADGTTDNNVNRYTKATRAFGKRNERFIKFYFLAKNGTETVR